MFDSLVNLEEWHGDGVFGVEFLFCFCLLGIWFPSSARDDFL